LNSASRILKDTSANNIFTILDRQAVGIGTLGLWSEARYCNPLAPKCIHYVSDVVHTPHDFSDLPICNAENEGSVYAVNNSITDHLGAIVVGGGTYKVLASCNGTNWTVAAN